jgi:hypothetical protein
MLDTVKPGAKSDCNHDDRNVDEIFYIEAKGVVGGKRGDSDKPDKDLGVHGLAFMLYSSWETEFTGGLFYVGCKQLISEYRGSSDSEIEVD